MQPQVQGLDQIIADLNPAFSQQQNILNSQRGTTAAQFGAQRSALDASKVQGFNQINSQAAAKGLAFSGIPVDEQANYLSTKYLPGLQSLDAQQNDANLSIDKALAQLDSERRLKAMDIRQNQQSTLDSFLAAERQRQFDAQQKAMDRAATAAQNPTEDVQIVKNAAGGWKVLVNGKPSNQYDLATAATMTGKSVLSLLQSGSQSDKKAYENYARTQDLAALKRNTGAFYLGGAFGG